MFKFENTAKIEDVIKAYDFDPKMTRSIGEQDRYIQGSVIAKGTTPGGYEGYTILITEDSGKTEGGRVGDTGYVPFEVSFMEYDERIEVMEAA